MHGRKIYLPSDKKCVATAIFIKEEIASICSKYLQRQFGKLFRNILYNIPFSRRETKLRRAFNKANRRSVPIFKVLYTRTPWILLVDSFILHTAINVTTAQDDMDKIFSYTRAMQVKKEK